MGEQGAAAPLPPASAAHGSGPVQIWTQGQTWFDFQLAAT